MTGDTFVDLGKTAVGIAQVALVVVALYSAVRLLGEKLTHGQPRPSPPNEVVEQLKKEGVLDERGYLKSANRRK